MPVPPHVQAALFKRIFSFDRSFDKKQPILVWVAVNDSSNHLQDGLVTAFKAAGVPAKAIMISKLSEIKGRNSIIYIVPGTKDVKPLCNSKKVLSISGFPALVEKGAASIGIGLKSYKPHIIVNMPSLEAEGHEISARLLKLATVIR